MSETTESTAAEISARIREWARDLGFDAVGLASIRPSDHAAAYR
jgi:epoxyqueuosine reductase QueG